MHVFLLDIPRLEVAAIIPKGDYMSLCLLGADIDSALVDVDGSESLSLKIEAIPVGATLSDGTNNFLSTSGTSTADVTDWDLTNLTVTAPQVPQPKSHAVSRRG